MITKNLWRLGLGWALMGALFACAPSAGDPEASPTIPVPFTTVVVSPTPPLATASAAAGLSTRAPGASLGVPLTLAGGQSVRVDTGLTITFQAVLEDSRCPTDVDCVWAGRAKVAFQVEAPGQAAATLTLITLPDQPTPTPATYAGYAIALLDLAPYPQQLGQALALAEYEATVQVIAAVSQPD
jgi:hypothetical protein